MVAGRALALAVPGCLACAVPRLLNKLNATSAVAIVLAYGALSPWLPPERPLVHSVDEEFSLTVEDLIMPALPMDRLPYSRDDQRAARGIVLARERAIMLESGSRLASLEELSRALRAMRDMRRRLSPNKPFIVQSAPNGDVDWQFLDECVQVAIRVGADRIQFRTGYLLEDALPSSGTWLRGLIAGSVPYSVNDCRCSVRSGAGKSVGQWWAESGLEGLHAGCCWPSEGRDTAIE